MSTSWSCPHEVDNMCYLVNPSPCEPGMKGCILHGRFIFAKSGKNESRPKKSQKSSPSKSKKEQK